MARRPKHKVGQRVRYNGTTGTIRKVSTEDPNMPKYTIDFGFSTHTLREDQVERA